MLGHNQGQHNLTQSSTPTSRQAEAVSGPSTPSHLPSPLPLPRPTTTTPDPAGQTATSPLENAAQPLQTPGSAEVPDDAYARSLAGKKRRWGVYGLDDSEQTHLESISLGYQLALAQDQADTLYPEPPTAFTSTEEVVERLLPYHIWQIHDEELEGRDLGSKGNNAREQREMRDARELVKGVNGVHERFAKLRRREGTHPSHLPSVISLIQSSTTALREELAVIQTNLRSARAEYESLDAVRRERERVRAAAAAQAFPGPPRPSTSSTSAKPSGLASSSSISTPSKAQTPTSAPIPSMNTAASKTAPSTPTPTPDSNKRTRGRPAKGPVKGLREAVLTQTAAPPAKQSPAAAKSTPGTSTTQKSTSPSAKLPTANSSQNPVNITVSMGIIPQFVNLGLIVVPSSPTTNPKPPATIVKTTDDKKSVVLSINLSACTQVQLQGLAKLLNVTAKPSAVAAAAKATGSANGSPETTPAPT